MLKHQHLLFVIKFLETNSAKDSYKHAYPQANDNTCKINGCKLLLRQDIKDYISEQQEILKNKSLVDKEELLLIALNIARDSRQEGTKLKAIDTLNKMLGYYSPVESKTKAEVVISNPLEHLTDEELDAILTNVGDTNE